ncbi:MAG TPA: phosphopantetheine-binding protein [Opitutales bacterium]|nr:phosphopantetheine-binding protein [Opitutales bacterium]
MATQNLSPEEIEAIKESMRRCSPQTIDSAIQYRSTKDASLVPAIVTGIIERFLEPEARTLLKEKGDDVRIFDDLGVDSLTMLEIVMLVEDIIQITMDNDDLKDLRTINDIRSYIARKVPVA